MRHLILLTLLLLSATPAQADMSPWVVNAQTSTLTFSGTQEGEAFTGHFATFTPEIIFDPARLSDSHIKVVIDMTSASTGNTDIDGSLPGPDWLDVSTFKEAIFETTSITSNPASDKEGISNYTATGKLTLMGVTQDITFPFSLKSEGTETHAFADIPLKRLDFGVGKKADSTGSWVSNDIKVHFDVYAHP